MRIITGSARGARLKTPKGMGTRPTAAHIKESLFNILGYRVAGRTVLDTFAGTGALGLEALSRGAASAVFIDQATSALIQENAEHTHLTEHAEIFRGDAFVQLQRLAAAGRQFDLVFCDPPYHKGLWQRALAFFDEKAILKTGAIVVVEHGTDEAELPELASLECVRQQRYGSTTQLSFFQPKGEGGEDS